MDTFWEEKHKYNDVYWISGTNDAHYILDLHKISRNISELTILDIGIGAGHLSRYLHNNKNNIICCDISKNALENVKSFAKTYLTNELNMAEPVDLAICNLVFQHCNDNEVQRILNDVNLKDTGYFTFQFAFLRDNEELKPKVKKLINMGTHHFRSLDKIKEMVKNANKKIIKVLEPIHYYGEENFSWYIVKVANN
jgi:2-polyprenyl-3-methyl-5-hydroxy-6-metoxy-1,4-benzoquinol methylase